MPEDELIELSTTELKPHPKNSEIYGDEEADPELVESIRQNGQLEPLVINREYVIISGHRRWMALKTLNMPAKCRFMDFEDELAQQEAIVEFNRQREKVPSQIYHEVVLLRDVYSQRAKLNSDSNLKQNQSTDPLNSAARTKFGDTRDILARAVGIKRDKLEKIIDICEKAESGDDVALRALRKLDSGEVTVYSAHTQVRINDISKSDTPQSKYASTLLPKIESGEVTPNQAMKKINEYKEPVDKPVKQPVKPPKGEYNVIVAEPPLPLEDFMQFRVPASEDSVLFLWSTVKNLKQSLEVMAWWNFEYKSMIYWDLGSKASGSWITTSNKLLLIGIRGDFPAPEARFPGLLSGEKPEYAYEIIEQMFPSQKYAELFVENKREGWNVDQPTLDPSTLKEPKESVTVSENVEAEQLNNTPENPVEKPFILYIGTRDMGLIEKFNNDEPSISMQCNGIPKKQVVTELWDNLKHKLIFTFEGKWSPEKIIETADKKINEYLDAEERLPKDTGTATEPENPAIPGDKDKDDIKQEQNESHKLPNYKSEILQIITEVGELQIKQLIEQVGYKTLEKIPDKKPNKNAYRAFEARIRRSCEELRVENLLEFKKVGQSTFFAIKEK